MSEKAMTNEGGIRVLALLPFWRYAVVPKNLQHCEPALPFYRKKTAMEFIRECKKDNGEVCPDYKMVLYRKVWFRQVVKVAVF